MKIITPIYRDEKATEQNELLEQFLSELQMEHEALIDAAMDLSLNNKERREKTFSELMETPNEFHEVINLRTEANKLNEKIMKLKEILYSGYEETPVNPVNKNRREYTKREEIPKELGKKVKPLIFEGITNQYELAAKTGIPSSTLSYWVQKAYGVNWREYVELVKQRIY